MTATSEIVGGVVHASMFCDGGPEKFPELEQHTISVHEATTIYSLRRQLRKKGWTHDKSGDYCPYCTAVRTGRSDSIAMLKASREHQARLEIYVGDLMNDARGG